MPADQLSGMCQEMKTSRFPRGIIAAPLLLLFLASSASAQALYEQYFNNSSSSVNATASSVGWSAYVSSSATNISNIAGGGSEDRVSISYLAGNPNTSLGFLFAANPQTSNQVFAAVTTFSSITPTTFSWKQGNANTGSSVRLMVQVNGNWYATSQAFTNTVAYTAAEFAASTSADVSKSFAFTTTASAWRSVSLVSGSTLSLGSVLGSDLSSSAITGVGFFIQSPTINVSSRIDSLVIVPEPGTLGLAGAGLLGMLLVRRRLVGN